MSRKNSYSPYFWCLCVAAAWLFFTWFTTGCNCGKHSSNENPVESRSPENTVDSTHTEPTDASEPTPENNDRETPPKENRPDAPKETRPEPNPDENKPYGIRQRIPNTTCKLPGSPDTLQPMKIEVAFSKLSFQAPLYITSSKDGTDRLFVVEQAGTIRVFQNQATVGRASLFLDIRSKVSYFGEKGLLGLAFHPKYKTNGYFYVYYSTESPHQSVISRFSVKKNNPNQADPNSEVVLMRVNQPRSNHNGGMIDFGPDGNLYISLGDGGSAGDPFGSIGNGQNRKTLLGSILRIDVTTNPNKYTVPKDNPFVNVGAIARPEIWAYGLRNVWRFSFDRLSGALWAGDVGQNAYEEIDIIRKGGNYGWRLMEGKHCYNPSSNCQRPNLILPIHEYPHSQGKSITGGYVYRGKRIPKLYGSYIYGDFRSGRLWGLRYDGQKVTQNVVLVETFKNIASFGEDEQGEIYFAAFDGKIYRLAPKQTGGGNNPFPTRLSQTGCFASLQPLTPQKALIPYGVNVPLWSDHLDKQRWLALPGSSQITYKDEGHWQFPDGTVIIKHFSNETIKNDPKTRQNIETRFYVKNSGEWRGYTYLWNAEQTDAFLLDNRAQVPIEQSDPSTGNTRKFKHIVPSRNDCAQCHTPTTRVLGLETRQINGDFDYNGITDNQLRTMEHLKLFVGGLPSSPQQLPKIPRITDSSASIADRARAYLHSNCSNCHRPGVSGVTSIDLRATTSLANMKACNVPPKKGDLGVSGAKILAPKDPNKSVLYLRMSRRGENQMPQLGTQLVHKDATKLLQAWIQGLRRCP